MIYHIVDHEGRGTIHELIETLSKDYPNNILIYKHEAIELIHRLKINDIIVLHTTGQISDLLMNYYSLFDKYIKYIFIHVSYDYLVFKKKEKFVDFILNSNLRNVLFLVPSKEIKEQYEKVGLKCQSVVMGINDVQNNNKYKEYNTKLSKYYNKIVTTCSSSKNEYLYVKGIDLFNKLVDELDIKDKVLIAGIHNEELSIMSEKFSHDDFLNILYHSLAYVQLSRYESYNLTAVEAKRFMIPVILLNVEGVKTCMQNRAYNDYEEIKEKIQNVLAGERDENVEKNFYDSIERETTENLNNSFLKLTKNRILKELRVSITTRCNMKCYYCHSEGNYEYSELTLEQIERLCDAAVKLGLQSIRLTGGDPLVHPNFYEICKTIIEHKLKLEINTNCVAFDKLLKVVDNGWVSRIIVGIDYYDKPVSKHSPCGKSSKEILNNILILKQKNVDLCIDAVYDGDYNNIEKLTAWAINNKVRIKILEIVKNQISSSSSREYLEMMKNIMNKYKLTYKVDEIGETNGYNGEFKNVSFFHSLCRLRNCDICKKIQLRVSSTGYTKTCIFYSKQDINVFDGDIYANLCKSIELPVNYYYYDELKIKDNNHEK